MNNYYEKNKNTEINENTITKEHYENVIKQLKKERRKVRKINRERFNDERRKAAEKAANGPLEQELYEMAAHCNELNNKYKAVLTNALISWGSCVAMTCMWALRELYFASECYCK